MKLSLCSNNYLMRIDECTKEELAALDKVTRATSYSFITKRTETVSYLHNYTFVFSGLYRRVLKLSKYGYNVKIAGIQNLIHDITREKLEEWLDTQELPFAVRYYQFEALYLLLKYHISRIEVGTGGGKSLIIYLYCRYLVQNILPKGQKILLVVPRRMLVKQMTRDFLSYNNDGYIVCDNEFSGGVRFADANVVIGTYQTLSGYDKEYFTQFGAFIVDESHYADISSIRINIFGKMDPQKVQRRIGTSGTQPDEDSIDGLHAEAVLGPVLLRVPASELVEEKAVVPVKIKFVKIIYSKSLQEIRGFWHNEDITILSKRLKYERTWMHTAPARNYVLLKILGAFKGNQLVLVESVKYSIFIRDMVSKMLPHKRVILIHGGVGDAARDQSYDIMENEDNVIMVATYGTMSTGVSINNIMALHFPDGGKSTIRIKQSLGRGMRLHPKKDHLVVFDYWDILQKHFAKADFYEEGYEPTWPGPAKNIFNRQANERKKIYIAEKHSVEEVVINVNTSEYFNNGPKYNDIYGENADKYEAEVSPEEIS